MPALTLLTRASSRMCPALCISFAGLGLVALRHSSDRVQLRSMEASNAAPIKSLEAPEFPRHVPMQRIAMVRRFLALTIFP